MAHQDDKSSGKRRVKNWIWVDEASSWPPGGMTLEEIHEKLGITSKEWYQEVYGRFEVSLPALADDVWELFQLNLKTLHYARMALSPCHLLPMLAEASYDMAVEQGYKGTLLDWRADIRDAGITHHRRHRKPLEKPTKQGG